MTTAAGIRATVMAGKGVPRPISATFTDALESIEVTEVSGARSGIQLVFLIDRSPRAPADYPVVASTLFAPFSRIVVMVWMSATPNVLFDGFVTHQELTPSDDPKQARFTVTGEDVSVMMDLEEKTKLYPGQNDAVIAMAILARYARYGVVPMVVPPKGMDQPLPTQRVPAQYGTDLEHLREMASRYGYLFHVTPTPVPGTSRAYWGPPPLRGVPQGALSVAIQQESNVTALTFRYDSLAPARSYGVIQDPASNRRKTIDVAKSTLPALSRRPALTKNKPNVRRTLVDAEGLSYNRARAQAQGDVDDSTTTVVLGEGELDALQYGRLLRAKSLVGVRGAGRTFDGTYYVSRVTHLLRRGELRQKFTLAREGVGALLPVVRP